MQLDWDDLRYFLAVIENGSTKRAAKALKVDQTTCARRIASLEEALGLTLFDRRPSGFTLTADGERLRPMAEAMGRSADEIASVAAQSQREHQAVFRLSVGDLLVDAVVRPALSQLRKKWPEVRVDVAVETRYVDIMKGEADFAIRPGSAPEEPDLIVRRLGDNPVAVYCTQAYAERFGIPGTIVEHLDRPFACMEGRALDLISAAFPDKRPGFVVSTLQPLVEAVASGEFAAILPSFHAESLPGFVRCCSINVDTGSVWLIYHPRFREQPAARDLARCLVEAFASWATPGRLGEAHGRLDPVTTHAKQLPA